MRLFKVWPNVLYYEQLISLGIRKSEGKYGTPDDNNNRLFRCSGDHSSRLIISTFNPAKSSAILSFAHCWPFLIILFLKLSIPFFKVAFGKRLLGLACCLQRGHLLFLLSTSVMEFFSKLLPQHVERTGYLIIWWVIGHEYS